MNQKRPTTTLIVLGAVLIGIAIYFAIAKNIKQIISQNTLSYVDTSATTSVESKIYQNQKYGFEFQYPKGMMITANSSENELILAGEDGGHWVYDVRIENNLNNSTLNEIVAKEHAGYDKIVSDLIFAGKPAKRYSAQNYGDYGNAGVIFLVGNSILTIYGDDSITSTKNDFDLLLSTFKFTK